MFNVFQLRQSPHHQVIFLAWIIVASVIFATGCGGDSNRSTDEEIYSTLISLVDGGTCSFDQVDLSFPPGAVDESVSVSVEIVALEDIPLDIIPLSDVYRISLSNPEVYNALTATLRFTLDEDLETAHIYHSNDGLNWQNLVGDVDQDTITVNVHAFSYFMVGSLDANSGVYQVTFVNNSNTDGQAYLYQINPSVDFRTVYPTVWMARRVSPNSRGIFQWRIDYAFCWAETGPFQPGIVFRIAAHADADLNQRNQITLDRHPDGYPQFIDQSQGPQPGLLYINQNANIPSERFSVGYAMSRSPVVATQANPNVVSTFNPAGTTYHVVFHEGDPQTSMAIHQDQVLDQGEIASNVQIDFPPNVYHMVVTLNADHTFSIGTLSGSSD